VADIVARQKLSLRGVTYGVLPIAAWLPCGARMRVADVRLEGEKVSALPGQSSMSIVSVVNCLSGSVV
jgi:hypothetical protein